MCKRVLRVFAPRLYGLPANFEETKLQNKTVSIVCVFLCFASRRLLASLTINSNPAQRARVARLWRRSVGAPSAAARSRAARRLCGAQSPAPAAAQAGSRGAPTGRLGASGILIESAGDVTAWPWQRRRRRPDQPVLRVRPAGRHTVTAAGDTGDAAARQRPRHPHPEDGTAGNGPGAWRRAGSIRQSE